MSETKLLKKRKLMEVDWDLEWDDCLEMFEDGDVITFFQQPIPKCSWTFTKEELIEAREESHFSDNEEFSSWLHDGFQEYTNDSCEYTVRRDSKKGE